MDAPLAIVTEHLTLRPHEPGDLEVLQALRADASAAFDLLVPEEERGADATKRWLEARLERRLPENAVLTYALVRTGDEAVVGFGDVTVLDAEERLIRVGLLEPYREQGYGREAARALTNQALLEEGVLRIVAFLNPENEAAVRMAQGLDYHEAGTREVLGFGRWRWVTWHPPGTVPPRRRR